MAREANESSNVDRASFNTTHWSVVLTAGGDDTRSQKALEKLCQAYWYPLYAFVRRQGYGPEDAQDLTQGFFAHLLETYGLARADRARGRFRSFLLVSLRNFLANEWDRAHRQKRGGDETVISYDAVAAETRYGLESADANASPEKVFERAWGVTLLEQVRARLRAEQEAVGKGAQFAQLQDCLMGEPDAPTCAELGTKLGVKPDAVRAAVTRLRRRYRHLVRAEIAQTVSSPVEIEEEIRHLFAVFSA